jgi:hypothetical protein
MPSYAPAKPPPRRRVPPRPLNIDWVVKRTNAAVRIKKLLAEEQDPDSQQHFIAALRVLESLRYAKHNRAYNVGFIKIRTHVLHGLGLQGAKET